MMSNPLLFAAFAATVLLLCVQSTNAQAEAQIANDPPAYFGGVDNQAYLDWLANVSDKYEHSAYISSSLPGKGAAVHWSITDDEYLNIAVAAPSMGWVGFGLSEAGGMYGSDMAIFVKKNPTEILDAHVVDVPYPQVDDCQQDWEYVGHFSTSDDNAGTARQATTNFLMFEARRKLDTGDLQDLKINNDADPIVPATRIIAAWGDQENYSFHGPSVARGAVRFYGSASDLAEEASFDEAMAASSEGSFFVGASDYPVTAQETDYIDICLTRADLIAQGVPDTQEAMSIVGFKPIVSEETRQFVHHYIVTALVSPSDTACEDETLMNMVYVWAPGELPWALPEKIGTPLFGTGGFQGFNIEIHYDNPTGITGKVDNSGVEIFYTSQVREIELGVLPVADPNVGLFGDSVGIGISEHTFECKPECSNFFVGEGQSVTVLREHLHMHVAGTRMTNEVLRDGETIHSTTVEVWDFDQNGNLAVQQQPYELKAGDSFRTKCYYDSSRGGNGLAPKFGLGSFDEMCIAFLIYYPRKAATIPGGQVPWMCDMRLTAFDRACQASHEGGIVSDVGRVFGTSCDAPAGAPNAAPTESSTSDAPAGAPNSAPTEGTTSSASMKASSLIVATLMALLVVV